MPAFLWFLCAMFIGGLAMLVYLLRGTWTALAEQTRDHAQTFAIAYVKAGALIAIAMGACFTETFSNLTSAQAETLNWWHWIIYFWKPVAAGLATLCAFLDRSVAHAEQHRNSRQQNNPPVPTP